MSVTMKKIATTKTVAISLPVGGSQADGNEPESLNPKQRGPRKQGSSKHVGLEAVDKAREKILPKLSEKKKNES